VRKKHSPLIFGEVLFDCFPDGRETLGGAPFNVAWNLQAFGMAPLFISSIGNDNHGRRIMEQMKSWGMDTRFVQRDPVFPTGKVQIALTKGEPIFTILPDRAYDHILPPAEKLKQKPSFLYHGSLALRKAGNRHTLSQPKRESACPIFLDVNLRRPWWEFEHIHDCIREASWLKLNEDELNTLFPALYNLEHRCTSLLETFGLEAVFVTRGNKGAVACMRNGTYTEVEPEVDVEVVDTVGAGDAFSSVLLLGLTRNWSPKTILARAQEFASAVVEQRGAISDNRDFYQSFTMQWDLQ